MPIAHPPIPPAAYLRIFRVLKSVFDGTGINTAHPSIFFSIAGAHLVEQFYKKRCQPVAGAAFYKVDDSAGTILTFADRQANNDSLSSTKGFHCWTFCEGYIVDFMAPLFPESLQASGAAGSCSRKMFQKSLPSMADSPLLMHSPGDFYLLPNVELTREILNEFISSVENTDAVKTCAHWYKKPPKEIMRQMSVPGREGTTTHLRLSDISLTGVW